MTDYDRREFVQRLVGAVLFAGTAGIEACSHAAQSAPSTPTPAPADTSLRTLDRVTLRHFSGATAEISRRGAQVTSWKRANGVEMLFMAQSNQFAPGEAMRGGIPVVFPQFGSMGTLPMHGLIKAAMWEVLESSKDPNGAAYAVLRTSDTEVTRGLWPHPFRATLRVTLDEALSTSLTIENTGNAPFEFQAGLHTYLRVGDVRRVTIEGFERATYQDWRRKGVERREGSAAVRITGPINRVYLRRPDRIKLYDESRGRTLLIDRAGFGDVVVWNPGEKDARTFGLAEGEYLNMLAVEPAQIEPKVQLGPGLIWS
ncbi:MAG TPA: D-hexose-6-phosphate mutarotase, partial [Gemmatimonadaceae bacterium]